MLRDRVRHADTSTGTFSIFTKVINKFDVMFHVSTYIPFHGADAQQVERKRHLGNDVGLIIFKGGAHTAHTRHTRTQAHTLPIAVWCWQMATVGMTALIP
jgi:hypothetical protein